MTQKPIKKLLAANRGEIAIRIFRACTELGIRTVAIYGHEDLLAIHRYKADEAFLIGTEGAGAAAYLDQDAIIQVAKAHGVDAIHPGYGFLSENEDFARRCAAEGIIFIGPKPETLEMLGDKTRAREVAKRCQVPTVPGSDGASCTVDEVRSFGAKYGFPLILKAAFGGGGRGMRIVYGPDEVDEAFARAAGESEKAFGRSEVFCEKFVQRARHIEVQILADQHGQFMHLFERDCSVQRRHQKVIEYAPALNLSTATKEALYDSALKLARACNYVNAGTVEFLVDDEGGFFFIEVNPRIQVEHTVTELITGVDLVQCQIRIAEGARLEDKRLALPTEENLRCNGFAIQCRVTTEDPQRGFLPDTGKISAFRVAGGFGIRIDAGTGGTGSVVSGDFDSLIVKVSAWASTFEAASQKALRSLREFRIRGVKTNIPFLENAITHPEFLDGKATTRFIDNTPELLEFKPRKDRATKLLRALASSVVNGFSADGCPFERPKHLFVADPPAVSDQPVADSPAMTVFRAEGAEGLSSWLRNENSVQLTDTTFRDAHQSLLATRVRTKDLLAICPATRFFAGELFSLEMWGGATFDVAYRFLKEDPWSRLEQIRRACPNLLLQMLLRGANGVGYTNYPDNVIRRFVRQAAEGGIDIFRIFDALNWLPNMELAIDEVNKVGKIAEATICYTGDLLSPNETKYDLKYYLGLAKALEKRGAHILAIKDMAGLLKPRAASALVTALRDEVGLPIHLHTHDTSGNGIAMLLSAIDAGVDAVDAALSPLSGLTSQPSINALLAALEGHQRAPRLTATDMGELVSYWEGIRDLYSPFESGLRASTAEVYQHEIPGGQYSNLRPRANQLGLGSRWGEVKRRYREVNDAFGRLVKVTPTSKVVADFAMFLVQNGLTVEEAVEQAPSLNFPQSVVDFVAGRLGQPHGGFPEKLRTAILKGEKAIEGRVGETLSPHDFDSRATLLREELGRAPAESDCLSDALYPKVFADYRAYIKEFGDVSILPTEPLLYGLRVGETVLVEIEEGKTLVVTLMAVGGLTDRGERMVYFELNGQPREILVRDEGAQKNVRSRPKASKTNPFEIGASMPGKILSVAGPSDEALNEGSVLVVVEAMKMETSITAPCDCRVVATEVSLGDQVEGGDLLVRLEPI